MSDVPFRDHFEARLEDLEKWIKAQFAVQDEKHRANRRAVKLAVRNSHWLIAALIPVILFLVALLLKK